MEHCILQIALDAPLDTLFDYRWPLTADGVLPCVGHIAIVPFGRREVAGMVVGVAHHSDVPVDKLKDALAVHTEVAPLSAQWIALCTFASDYYHRPLGEVVMPALPKNLRAVKPVALAKALKNSSKPRDAHDATAVGAACLTPDQQAAIDMLAQAKGFAPHLLYGVTGSGKTEVYLQAAARLLEQNGEEDNRAQILILVPEINLTPQLENNIRARFPSVLVATLHSGLAEGERLGNWLAAHLGHARIVLGTRLALLSSMPHLKMIVVDEEHDPSYKQQEGLRYSARDLAVWRARQLGITLVLGSATPSLETWHHAQCGRYRRLDLPQRAVHAAVLPTMRLIDMERDKPVEGITATLLGALQRRYEQGEQ
ncbi:MAG: DEAD/DEAH box helicase, partial [Pseudomonadota bacterium]|nr:DEAD/DEAH box helicase [Pseudomonadota bacterium]